MNIYEFIARTGYYPTEKQFEAINREYMEAGEEVDKTTFCRNWKSNSGIEKASFEAQREIWVLQGAKEEAVKQAIIYREKAEQLEAALAEANLTIKELREDKKQARLEINSLEEQADEFHERVAHLEEFIEKISKTLHAEISQK